MPSDIIYDLHSYTSTTENVKLINVRQLGYSIWLRIPEDIASQYVLFTVEELLSKREEVQNFSYFIERENLRPWLKVRTDLLNKEEGFHSYKFSFVHIKKHDIISLYFTYNMQNDNPSKSYLFKNRKNLNPEVEREFLNMDDGQRWEGRL